jgi:hypothetical protein
MNCDQIQELLPWLLNGTLEEQERRTVREHLSTCASCRLALTDTRRAWEIFDQHIPTAALVAHAAGDPPEGIEPALFEAHLASCPECAAELELARMSRGLAEDDSIAVLAPRQPRPAPASGTVVRPTVNRWKAAALAAGLAGLVAANGWYQTAEKAHTLAGRLTAASQPAPAPPPLSTSSAAPTEAAAPERVAALQDQLAQMQKTLGELQTVEAQHRQQLSQIAEKAPAAGPQINTWVGDAREGGDVVRGNNDIPEVPAGAPAATLILRPTDAKGGRDIEITDAQGRVIWSAKGLRLDPVSQDFSLTFHRGDLAPGDYVIHLYRTENGQKTAAESYPIRVR